MRMPMQATLAAIAMIVPFAAGAQAMCLTGEEVLDRSGPQSYLTPPRCAVCAVPPDAGLVAPEGRSAASLRALPLPLRPAAPGATTAAAAKPCPPAPAETPAG